MTEEPIINPSPPAADPAAASNAIRRFRRLAVGGLVLLAFPVSALAGGYLGSQLLRNQLQGPWTADSGESPQLDSPLMEGELEAALPPQSGHLAPPRFRFDADGFPASSFEAPPRREHEESATDDGTTNLLEPERIEGSSEGGPGLFGTEDWAALDQISDGEGDDPTGPTEAPPAEPERAKTYQIQVEAFEKRLGADQLVSELRSGGYAAAVVERELPSGKVVFRVIVGPYATKDAANEAAAQLNGLGHTAAWVSAIGG